MRAASSAPRQRTHHRRWPNETPVCWHVQGVLPSCAALSSPRHVGLAFFFFFLALFFFFQRTNIRPQPIPGDHRLPKIAFESGKAILARPHTAQYARACVTLLNLRHPCMSRYISWWNDDLKQEKEIGCVPVYCRPTRDTNAQRFES